LRAGSPGKHPRRKLLNAIAHIGAQRRRGPSMYEMEGPRLRPAALTSRLLSRRVLRDACLAALAGRLLRCCLRLSATGVRFPTSAPVAQLFRRSRGLGVRAGCPALPSSRGPDFAPVARPFRRSRGPDLRAGCPALPSVPWFPLGQIPSSVVRDFYCHSAAPHKAFPARTSRFFSHPQDICRLSPVHSSFPLAYAQVCPQSVWTDRPRAI
jgi:hypothetical protein